MERVELQSASRTVAGKQVKKLRSEGIVPAVIFGPDTPSKMIQAPERAVDKTLRQAGSMLINLFVDQEDQPRAVLAREVQRHPITGRIQHVDFYQVRMTEKVRTTIPLHFVGEPPLVESGEALLNPQISILEVECLPDDLQDHITVDVSGLLTMHDTILVGDLALPSGITALDKPDDVIASLQHMRVVEEVEVEAEVPAEEAAEEKEAEAEPEE
ncbi:MAG: 50S ribosomal protein L25 [Anaerolineae bacterium]|nr:50S ribosomal protein L25 [Anaerolineae bacterium]